MSLLPDRIHIFGASGTGTTSLGQRIAAAHGHEHLDTDSFYWVPTDPPFTKKRPPDRRLELLGPAMDAAERWVLSGSLCGWGDPLIGRFELVIFLFLDPEIRMARLYERERQRYGDEAIAPGGPMHDHHRAFLAWAAAYDTAGFELRSRTVHEAWIAKLPCPVVRIGSDLPSDDLLDLVERAAVG